MTKKQISQYIDIKEILDLALQHGGGTYDAGTPGKATNFRFRVNSFRKIYRESIPATDISPYDRLDVSIDVQGSPIVTIRPRKAVGTFTPAGGAPVVDVEADPLFDIAKNLADKLL